MARSLCRPLQPSAIQHTLHNPPLPSTTLPTPHGNPFLFQGKYAEALEHYEAAAAAHPKLQDSVALLDNRALALLLLNRPQECADLTAQCLALSPQFVPALLHRARALRCLDPHNLKPAAETLQTAQELVATNHTLDILREWLLLRIERSERTLSPTGSPGRDDILGALALKKVQPAASRVRTGSPSPVAGMPPARPPPHEDSGLCLSEQ